MTPSNFRVVALSFCLVAATPSHAASDDPSLIELLTAAGYGVELDRGERVATQQLRVRWSTETSVMRLVSRTHREETLPQQRSMRIAPGQLMIVMIDRFNTVRYARIVSDPRIVVTETPDASGTLHKSITRSGDLMFNLSVPQIDSPVELRILEPVRDASSDTARTSVAELATLNIAGLSP